VYARALTIGPTLLFSHIAETIGLDNMLRRVFDRDSQRILTCVYYILAEGTALGRCEQWSKGNLNPCGRRLIGQRISELLRKLTENSQKRFFWEWASKVERENNIGFI